MRRSFGAALVLGTLALPAQAQSFKSPTNVLYPAGDAAGGTQTSASANFQLGASAGQPVAGSTSSSAGFVVGPGLPQILYYPETITDLSGLADVAAASVNLQWSAPGADGGLGALQGGSKYFIRLASYTAPDSFVFTNADVSLSTSGTLPGAVVSVNAAGLIANTTYFVSIWTKDALGDLSYGSYHSTITTLALAPLSLPTTFVYVFDSSVTVNWLAMATAAQDVSSMTAEGFTVEASSTNFGALAPGGSVYSSSTPNVALSTLTVQGLNVDATHYFRIASLNWQSKPNYLYATMNVQIAQSTTAISFGSIDPTLYASTVSVSSMVVTNVGNVAVTFYLSAATTTMPSSPWTLAASTGDETVTLMGLWNAAQPSQSAFVTAITTSPTSSGGPGGPYAGGQNALTVPPGASRSLWFQFWKPTSTISQNTEKLQLTVKGRQP